nr:immunoglobulin heavy chain junction region [Mus musculus]
CARGRTYGNYFDFW